MTGYTWNVPYGDWINDPRAWSPNGSPGAGDYATIDHGWVYDYSMPTSAYYQLGNQDPAQAPWLVTLGTDAMNASVMGYANLTNYGNTTFNANIGGWYYWEPNQGGHLNILNYGAIHGNLYVTGIGGSSLSILGLGGYFGGTIKLMPSWHGAGGPLFIQNNLLPGTSVSDGGGWAGPGPSTGITFTGNADPSSVFNLGAGSELNLTQMSFLPSVDFQSDYASVGLLNWFSGDLQTTLHNGVLTIDDIGFGRSLSLHVIAPQLNITPGASFELIEPQHGAGGWFYGLSLEYGNASGPGVIHPTVY